MKSTKGCDKLSSNDRVFDDIWFSVFIIAEKANAEGVYYFGPVKKNHKGFCLAILEELTKDWSGGSHIDIKSAPRVPGDIRCNWKRTMGWILRLRILPAMLYISITVLTCGIHI